MGGSWLNTLKANFQRRYGFFNKQTDWKKPTSYELIL